MVLHRIDGSLLGRSHLDREAEPVVDVSVGRAFVGVQGGDRLGVGCRLFSKERGLIDLGKRNKNMVTVLICLREGRAF